MPKRLQLNGKIPEKLSDLENDLFYYKAEPFLTLTIDDFVFYSELGISWFEYPVRADWMTSVDSIWLKISIGESEESHNTITSDDMVVGEDIYYEEEECIDGPLCQSIDAVGIKFINGAHCDGTSGDVFIVGCPFDIDDFGYLSIEILKLDRKQIQSSEVDYSGFPFVSSSVYTKLSDDAKYCLVEQLQDDVANYYDSVSTSANSTKQRTIPIIETTGPSDTYDLGEIVVDKIPDSFLLLMIPHTDSNAPDPYATISWRIGGTIYKKTYKIRRISDFSTGYTNVLARTTSIVESCPVLLLLNEKLKVLFILSLTGETAFKNSNVGSCSSASNSQLKYVNFPYEFKDLYGSNAYISFKYANTAENTSLNCGNGYFPILDKSGNPIAANVLEADKYYHFVRTSNSWMLMDDTYSVNNQLAAKISTPDTAAVGQTIVVKSVDENGKPTEWEVADLPEQVQADWLEQDETAPGYVKNRPFYDGSWSLDTSNVLETNDIDSGTGFVLISNSLDDFVYNENIQYYCKYREIEYELVCAHWDAYNCDVFYYNDDESNKTTVAYVVTQENTSIDVYDGGTWYRISNPSIGVWVKHNPQSNAIVSIYTKEIHQIDPKFIPQQSMTVYITENDDGSLSADKTFQEISNIIENNDAVIQVKYDGIIYNLYEYEPGIYAVFIVMLGNNLVGLIWMGSDSSIESFDNKYIGDFSSASTNADGTSGLVPAPSAGDQDKFLKGDGTWSSIPTVTDDHINELINTALGVVENGTY